MKLSVCYSGMKSIRSGNSIFWPNTAFLRLRKASTSQAQFFDPRRSVTTPAVEKFLRPCDFAKGFDVTSAFGQNLPFPSGHELSAAMGFTGAALWGVKQTSSSVELL
jgi:hypothetical protein